MGSVNRDWYLPWLTNPETGQTVEGGLPGQPEPEPEICELGAILLSFLCGWFCLLIKL